MLDPEIITEAKSQAAKLHLTLGNVVEHALEEYLEMVRQAEEEKETRKEKEEQQRKRQEEDFRKKRIYERENGGPPSFVFR